jgi:hypothetical protein
VGHSPSEGPRPRRDNQSGSRDSRYCVAWGAGVMGKKAPAASEKRFLTYSLRALRPNGGLDPLAKQLRQEALSDSINGFATSDPVRCPSLFIPLVSLLALDQRSQSRSPTG